ncbi:MAG: ribonuclease M5 [Tenericutes bacterium HGW-Tenericutes-3]|nr:MAG: ribonuclease M5 [Tenericutes bacterium HGW-Tenericutes-3]
MRPKIFVVEGRNDESRLKQIYPNIQVVTTNGSAIDPDKVEVLRKFDETHEIVLFLDPDHAGERIRRLLGKSLTHVFHAFVDQNLAHSKNGKKIGIEHASVDTIQNALKDMQNVHYDSTSDVTHSFLHEIGLTGGKESKALRYKVASTLKIGHVNGKTLYHRLKIFNISQEKIIEVLK